MKNHIAFFLLSTVLACSCSQDEGFGGDSHLKGVLIEKYFNEDFSILQNEAPAKDEDIYIQFGDDLTVSENTSTSYSGNFEFNYLWPGNYKIFYYSDDTTKIEQDKKEIIRNIKLEKGETYSLDTVYTYKTLDWDEGKATIKGEIWMINYKQPDSNGNLSIKDQYPAQDYDIFIRYNNAEFYNDGIKTQEDGTFVFSNLLMGHYEIFTYSEDVFETIGGGDIIKLLEFDITSIDQVITTEQIVVQKS